MRPSTTAWSDPRLRWSIALALLVHGVLLVAGSFQSTYDAWVHIFFGDHYARDWFSTWEPRWYTGFTVTSYPPASHQAIGLLSRFVGLESAFIVIQLAAVVNIVAGVYRFSLLWVGREAAGWAALLTVVSSSIAEVVHTFGQLPTTMALGFLLHAQPSIRRWIHEGVRIDLIAAIALLAATTAGHHVTTLFGTVFFTGPVAMRALLDRWGAPIEGEPDGHQGIWRRSLWWPQVARRLRRLLPAALRAVTFGLLTIVTLIIVVLPYWLWSSTDPITQVPIPHASRNSFVDDTAAGLIFWLVPWASLLLLAPFALMKATIGRGWPLAASIGLLTLLGTGGTTPVPRMLLGGAFDILTLDRFTIWATIALLPFAGWAVVSFRDGWLGRVTATRFGALAPRAFLVAALATTIASSVFAATLTSHRPFQPRAIDPTPISTFMSKDDHDRWRYLTLGFGDQMAWISANTTALTVDGNYHSARRLPELTSRSVERLEGAKFRGIPGIGSLQQFLINPSPYHLKFVFSIDRFYDPLLWSSGWQRIGLLDNDVEVWERADVPPLPDVLPEREIPVWQRLMWGLLPLASVVAGSATLMWLASGRLLPRRVVPLGRSRPGAGRLLRRVDARLERAAAALHRSGSSAARLPWSRLPQMLDALCRRAESPQSPGRRRVHQLVLLVALAVPATVVLVDRTEPRDPAATIEAYYHALDVKQFGDAHSLLDPHTRPDLDEYLLGISLRDGLVDGYSELDSVHSVISRDGDDVLADVDLVYLTSVEEYDVAREHRLVRHDGTWFIEPDAPSMQSPLDQLVVRPEVSVSTLGRRVATTETTGFDDILDRPRLSLGENSTYRVGERWVLVGTVTNVDVDPADVTVNGSLRAEDGGLLARFDAGQATVHQVLPGETVSYRIDVEGRAGSVDRDDPVAAAFDPMAYSAPVLRRDVAGVEVASRAVVTDGQLERVLDITDATARATSDATAASAGKISFSARLRNAGTVPATVARITVTYLDVAGDVVWVDHQWVADAIRPRRQSVVSWTSTLPVVDVVDIPTATFDNGKVGGEEGTARDPVETLPVTGDVLTIGAREIAAVRLDVTSFQRQVAP